MKLRVVELLLVSTLPAMVLAAKGLPDFGLAIATIFAGTLAAGSANAFNMVIESDLDKLMARTAKRPIVTGLISKTKATVFASVIGTLSLTLFWLFTTPLATLLALIAIVFYVVVYTMALKQRTSQNIVWGGAAGCTPVLIGWAAVTNSLPARQNSKTHLSHNCQPRLKMMTMMMIMKDAHIEEITMMRMKTKAMTTN